MKTCLALLLFVILAVVHAEESKKNIKDVENKVKPFGNNANIEKHDNGVTVNVKNDSSSKLNAAEANELIKRAYMLRLRHRRSPKKGRSRERYRVHREDGYYDQRAYRWGGRSRGYRSRGYGGRSRGGRSRNGGRSRGGRSRNYRSSRGRSRESYYNYGDRTRDYREYGNGYFRRGYPNTRVIHIGYIDTGHGSETECQCPFGSDDPQQQQMGGPGYDREQDDSLEDLRRWHEAFAAHPCCQQRWALYWRSHGYQQRPEMST